jgi:hypothetical protein
MIATAAINLFALDKVLTSLLPCLAKRTLNVRLGVGDGQDLEALRSLNAKHQASELVRYHQGSMYRVDDFTRKLNGALSGSRIGDLLTSEMYKRCPLRGQRRKNPFMT